MTPLRTLSRLVNAASFGRTKYGWWSSPYESDASPIIIGGSPRSGTTLLRVMLDNHPQVWIGPENGVFQEAGQNLPGMEACLDIPVPILAAIRRRSACLGEFVDRTMARALEAQGKPIWGLKSPSVVHALGTVFRFFPGARFIHTLRDGRDVVASLRTHPKDKLVDGKRVPTGIINPWPQCVRQWVESTRAGVRWRTDSRYYEIRYEDLVTGQESVVRGLLDWLKLPYDDGVWKYYTRPVNQGIDSGHPGIAQPVYQSAVERWTSDLTPEAVDAFTPEACDLLVELGYAEDRDGWKSRVKPRPSEVLVERH